MQFNDLVNNYHDPNPIYLDLVNNRWYFWNETWTETYGPYESYETAKKLLKEYVKTL